MIRKTVIVLAVLMLFACAETKTQQSEPEGVTVHGTEKLAIPEDLREEIERSSRLGQRLYVYDAVSAIATDVVLAQADNPRSRGIAGYLPLREADGTDQPKDSYVVHFFTNETPVRIAYEVRVARGKEPQLKEYNPARVVDAELLKLINARQLAIKSVPERVQPLNPVVMLGQYGGEEAILVYLIAATSKPDVAVFGRHYRALVSRSGDKLLKMTPLTNSVIEIPMADKGEEKVEALAVTHVTTDYPLETHVFTSLLQKLPVYVATRRGNWLVDGSNISLLKPRPQGRDEQ